MDKVLERRKIIKTFLEEQMTLPNKDYPLLRYILTVDEEESNFILTQMGWNEEEFVYFTVYHIEIKQDASIWFYENRTDFPIDDFLIEKGIPSTDSIAAWSHIGRLKYQTDQEVLAS
ncbi:MAG: element excision factor XisI family protein [Bacteroidota bacterium]